MNQPKKNEQAVVKKESSAVAAPVGRPVGAARAAARPDRHRARVLLRACRGRVRLPWTYH